MPSRAEDDNPKVKEFLTLFPEGRVEDGVVLQMAKCHKGPRIIKTHLQIDLLNHDLLDTCRVCASVLMKKNIASLRRIWTCVCCFFFFSDQPTPFTCLRVLYFMSYRVCICLFKIAFQHHFYFWSRERERYL